MGVYQRGDTGKWMAQLKSQGRRYYDGPHETKQGALEALEHLMWLRSRGLLERTYEAKKQTLGEVVRQVMKLRNVAAAKGDLSPETVRQDTNRMNVMLDYFGHDTPLVEIGELEVQSFLDYLVSERGVKVATANRYLAALSLLYQHLGLPLNPARGKHGREKPGGWRWLTPDEAMKLVRAAIHGPRYLEPLVTMALFTGMRLGELLALNWADVDMQQRVVEVKASKNASRRAVPLTSAARAALRRLGDSWAGPVFVSERTGERVQDVRTAFQAAVDRAGLGHLRFHDLRHTCASWMVQRGQSLRHVQEYLGHKSLAMVQRYSHLSHQHLRAAAESLPSLGATEVLQEGATEGENTPQGENERIH